MLTVCSLPPSLSQFLSVSEPQVSEEQGGGGGGEGDEAEDLVRMVCVGIVHWLVANVFCTSYIYNCMAKL